MTAFLKEKKIPGKKIFIKFVIAAALLLSPAPSGAEVIDKIVAIINDSIITQSELNAATAMAIDKLGSADKKDPKKVADIKGKMLDGLIEQKLVKQASDKAGIDISEREIDNAVEDIKKQNNISQDNLLVALAQSGLTYKEYREQLKEQIRQVKYVNKEIRSKINVLPEDIEAYYRQHQDEFWGQASYRINMIFLPGSDKDVLKLRLKAVEEGLRKGEDFKELAGAYSEGYGAASGGDMGYLKSGEIDEVIEAAAKKLKINGISGPVTTPEGVYFVQLVDLKAAAPKSLEEVKNQIHEKLFKKIMDERFNFWLGEVKKYSHIEIRL
ncbi:MAG: SurA N-terminal domain-containing protein [Deltaproteobacteria bacterium]|nr:SurA N-terminal domain-containing protein [Deltaproteobacteria bacterium]